jgi:hypothetical protein
MTRNEGLEVAGIIVAVATIAVMVYLPVIQQDLRVVKPPVVKEGDKAFQSPPETAPTAPGPRGASKGKANVQPRNAPNAHYSEPGASGSQHTTTAAPGAPVLRYSTHNLEFDLDSCSLNSGTVICTLHVTNEGEDQDLTLYARPQSVIGYGRFSRMIDDSGKTYGADLIQIGNATSARGWALPQVAQSTAVNGVRTFVSLKFGGVDSNASSISRLDIVCSEGRELFVVPLRRIPIESRLR